MKIRALLILVTAIAVSAYSADLAGTEKIVVPANGLLEKDHEALRMQWAEKQLLPEAEKRWQGQPWAEQAREVTQKGLQLWFSGPSESSKEADKTMALAKALLKTECEEPLACLMAHKILWLLGQDWWGGYRGLSKAFKIVNNDRYSAALRVWITDEQIDRLSFINLQIGGYHQKQADRILQAITDTSYSPEFETVLVRDVIDWMGNAKELNEEIFQKLEECIQNSRHSEWVHKCLLGDLHIHWAWFIRGTTWANEVKKDAWKGFGEHLLLASNNLTEAYHLRPERPEAAARMIHVTMGTDAEAEKLRVWFDRAIAAQFDYVNAYSGLLYACTARWGGSDELVLTLGKRFAETERYDTVVPEQLFHACKLIAIEKGKARRVFSDPVVKEAVLTMAHGLLEYAEPNPIKAERNKGLAAVAAWLAGDDALATRGLKAANYLVSTSVAKELREMLLHSGTLRTSVFAGNGGWGEEVRQLEYQYRKYDREAVLKTLASLKPESLSTDNARNYVADIRSVFEFPAKLKLGGWHPLPVSAGLNTCFCSGGNWRVTSPGEITVSGKDAAFIDLAFPIIVDKSFEIRGEISYELSPRGQWFSSWSFGPSLRWLPARHGSGQTPHAVRGLTFHTQKGLVEAQISGVSSYNAKGKQKVELKPANTFLASLNGEDMSFTFNETVIPPQNIESFGLGHSRGFVAFSGFNVPTGIKIKLKNLEVRLLSSAP